MKVNAALTWSLPGVVERATCSLSLVGTITMGCKEKASNAPLSQALGLRVSGRPKSRLSVPNGKPFWSVQFATGIRSIAGLVNGKVSSANVSVGPPLFANANNRGLVLLTLVPLNPQVPSSEMLKPRSVGAVLKQLLLVLFDQIVPLRDGP